MPTIVKSLTTNGNGAGGFSQDYIDKLKEKLEEAKRRYNEADSAAQNADLEYQLVKGWRDKLRKYADSYEATVDIFGELAGIRSSYQTHVANLSLFLKNAKKAVDVLIKCLRCLSADTEELNASVKSLTDNLIGLNKPELNTSAAIIKCLSDMQTALKESIDANLEAIGALLGLLRHIMLLKEAIARLVPIIPGGGDDASDLAVDQGLLFDLTKLQQIVNCSYCSGGGGNVAPVGDWCEIPTGTSAPPDCNKGQLRPTCPPNTLTSGSDPNSYYVQLSGKLEAANLEVIRLKDVRDQAQTDLKKAKSDKEALEAALKAATDTKAKCKN